jgi:3-isopropylmalate dehydrogenase
MAAPDARSDSTSPSRNILVLSGDHVGPEVVAEALKVLKVVENGTGAKFNLTHDLAGGCSIDRHGTPMTDAVLQKAKEVDAVFFGSVGGPKW